MHEITQLEQKLKNIAQTLSNELNGPEVIIIVAGSTEHNINRTMLGSNMQNKRLRDLLGILEVAKQLESNKHFSKIFQQNQKIENNQTNGESLSISGN